MERDLTAIGSLGAAILIFAFLLGSVFKLFTSNQSTIIAASNKLQNTSSQLEEAEYKLYDNTIVYGTAVTSAAATYSTEDIAVIIWNDSSDLLSNSNGAPAAKLPAATGETALDPYYYGAEPNAVTYDSTTGSYSCELKYSNGILNKNSNTSATKQKGMPGTYVNVYKRYDAVIARDATGTMTAIVFRLRQ